LFKSCKFLTKIASFEAFALIGMAGLHKALKFKSTSCCNHLDLCDPALLLKMLSLFQRQRYYSKAKINRSNDRGGAESFKDDVAIMKSGNGNKSKKALLWFSPMVLLLLTSNTMGQPSKPIPFKPAVPNPEAPVRAIPKPVLPKPAAPFPAARPKPAAPKPAAPVKKPAKPTNNPVKQPSKKPSSKPSGIPSSLPSSAPSDIPSNLPSGVPSSAPSNSTTMPSSEPSLCFGTFTMRNKLNFTLEVQVKGYTAYIDPFDASTFYHLCESDEVVVTNILTIFSNSPSSMPSMSPSSIPSNLPSNQPPKKGVLNSILPRDQSGMMIRNVLVCCHLGTLISVK
jgi:hypothetical protein